jgi:very-short-patch-repair endonuclease
MTKHYNKYALRELRKKLRNNSTDAEFVFWQELKGKKLNGYKFRRQYSIDCFVVDFYCTKVKLAVELDGLIHEKAEILAYDEQRQKIY